MSYIFDIERLRENWLFEEVSTRPQLKSLPEIDTRTPYERALELVAILRREITLQLPREMEVFGERLEKVEALLRVLYLPQNKSRDPEDSKPENFQPTSPESGTDSKPEKHQVEQVEQDQVEQDQVEQDEGPREVLLVSEEPHEALREALEQISALLDVYLVIDKISWQR